MLVPGVVPLVFAVSASEAVAQTLAFLSTRYRSLVFFFLGWVAYLGVLWFLTRAYKHKGIGFVNVLWSAITSILMLLIGHLLFRERLATQEWLGVAVVVVGVVIMNWKHVRP